MTSRKIIIFLFVWAFLLMSVLAFTMHEKEEDRAIILMGLGLLFVWGGVFGSLMYRLRKTFYTRFFSKVVYPKTTFVFFAVIFALLEEAVAVSMTNLAPFFGVAKGKSYITASTNYIDVVTHHSVIVFIPMFIVWSWLLFRYRFSTSQAFFLFGITGIFSEVSFAGPQAFINGGFWILVYGLMIYLPAYGMNGVKNDERKELRWYHYPMAIILPILAAALWAMIINLVLFPSHSSIHFS